ncbi:MAG: hypothetical protein WBA09_22135 [Candidatus Acidiferrum sp.]
MIVLILKLVEGPRCQGCGAIHRYVAKKSHLCLYCLGLQLDVNGRKKKLDSTVQQRFATLREIKGKLVAFNALPKTK